MIRLLIVWVTLGTSLVLADHPDLEKEMEERCHYNDAVCVGKYVLRAIKTIPGQGSVPGSPVPPPPASTQIIQAGGYLKESGGLDCIGGTLVVRQQASVVRSVEFSCLDKETGSGVYQCNGLTCSNASNSIDFYDGGLIEMSFGGRRGSFRQLRGTKLTNGAYNKSSGAISCNPAISDANENGFRISNCREFSVQYSCLNQACSGVTTDGYNIKSLIGSNLFLITYLGNKTYGDWINHTVFRM